MSALVTDTNSWLDLHSGDLVECCLRGLSDSLLAPDIVLHELKHGPSAGLLTDRLRSVELTGAQVAEVYALAASYRSISPQDLSALVVARSTGSTLVAGDGNLRKAALEQQVEVRGTTWLLHLLVMRHALSPAVCMESLHLMELAGSLLPEQEVRELKGALKARLITNPT